MKTRRLFSKQNMRKWLCTVLILAIVIGLAIPGLNINTVQPKAPSLEVAKVSYDTLVLGEREQSENANKENEEDADKGQLSKDETVISDKSDKKDDSESKESEEMEETESKNNSESDDTDTGDGDDGQEDGTTGEDGGEINEQALGLVMTWYKYGREAKTIVCGPSGKVQGRVNTAQLKNDELKYEFDFTGEKAKGATIKSVYVKKGDADFVEVSENGKIKIELPNASLGRTYTFRVDAIWKAKDSEGNTREEEISFTYEIHCSYAMDLELDLIWDKNDGKTGKVTIAANKKVAKTVEGNDLDDNNFVYTPKLTGALAKDAKLVSGEYYTASGESGKLDLNGGTLKLKAKGNEKEETYYITFVAEVTENGFKQKVYYHMNLVYLDLLDIDLSFTWLEKGMIPRVMICQPERSVSTEIKNNQLSAGAVKYEMALTGDDVGDARILSITYKSQAGSSGTLTESGALPLIMPAGYTSNDYTITVAVLSGGRQMSYEIKLHYVMDVQLEMTYSVKDSGAWVERNVICENGKTKTAELVYDDQLNNGKLSYKMTTSGTEKLNITSVSCYQSGSGSMVSLNANDQISLLLNKGKIGENTFRITAKDKTGAKYEFCIVVPYKHRGENLIKINTNMVDGQVVTNETNTNLSVSAWSEDESGKVVSYIPANGEDTKLIVKLDGEVLKYVSTSGPASEFILYPKNPVKGDTNEHTLYIYAEDPYGNYGELTLKLKGKRQDTGQKKGTATIRVDMSVVGLGVVDSVSYEILANEPISYSIVKAVLGTDTGDPFGACDNALGWGGRYAGTLDTGFYLQSLNPGRKANALTGSSWNKYGSNEKEILESIDKQFGEGTGLATLWRCIYRNGLNKSSGGDGSFGEFDFTSGSGWLYSLNGTYYPGLAMSEYRLEDGDVLTLRYTLAHGWDVGGGTTGYGNTIGYCVTAIDGKFFINHQMDEKKSSDGAVIHVCKCCGLEEECLHENMGSKNLGDGTHVAVCKDCKKTIGNPELHTWELSDTTHKCSACGSEEKHSWKEEDGSNTATCTEAGTRKVFCTVCNMSREESSPAKGHKMNNRWNHTKTKHYQKCSVCNEIIAESSGQHQYVYHSGDDDWYCKVCDVGHDWDYCGNDRLSVKSYTCKKIIYYCGDCGLDFEKSGNFPEYHNYRDGKCTHCGAEDPSIKEETTDKTTN